MSDIRNFEEYRRQVLDSLGEDYTVEDLRNFERWRLKVLEGLQAISSDPEAIKEAVEDWLDEHPEATTTVEDGAIATAKLASSAVTTAKVADGAVTDAKLASNGIKADVADLKSDLRNYIYGTSEDLAIPTASKLYQFNRTLLKGETYIFTNNTSASHSLNILKADGTSVSLTGNLAVGASAYFIPTDDKCIGIRGWFNGTGTLKMACEYSSMEETHSNYQSLKDNLYLYASDESIALNKSDFEQGYMLSGTGYVDTGVESFNYIVYRCNFKFKKGTKISVNCPSHYCAIDLYADNNWDSSSTRLDHIDYAQSIEHTLPNDGYLCITIATSNIYAQRTPILPSDYAEVIIISPVGKSNIYEYAYDGEKINTKKHGFNVTKADWEFVKPSNANAQSGQGATLCNGVIFKCWHQNVMQSYDAETGMVIAEFDSHTGHGNNISFSNEYYDANDEFPLAYISPEVTDGNLQLIHVLRLTRTSATLIRTLAFPVSQCGYYANAVVDASKNILYLNGYKYNSFAEEVVDGNDNIMKITAWDLNNLGTTEHNYPIPTFIKEFNIPFISTHQGHAFFDDKIFVVKSEITEITNTSTIVYVIDPYKEKIVSTFTDFPTEIKNNECEGIWFADNGNEYSMFICRLIQVYECIFN